MPTTHTPTAPGLQGASNFHDLGGHTPLDGRRVRTGLVPTDAQTVELMRLTDQDFASEV